MKSAAVALLCTNPVHKIAEEIQASVQWRDGGLTRHALCYCTHKRPL